MVECPQETTEMLTKKEFQTDRRVIKTLKKFTNESNVKCLLASSSMYAHNHMDGKVQIIYVNQLMKTLSDQNQQAASVLPTQ